jgi:hypothetical protein
MVSAINPANPAFGAPTTASVRANFEAAASEITALQNAMTGGAFLPVTGGELTGSIRVNWNSAALPAEWGSANVLVHLIGADNSPARIEIDGFGGGVGQTGQIQFRRAAGIAAAPEPVGAGLNLGVIQWWGCTAPYLETGASIHVMAAETWSAVGQGTTMELRTKALGGVGPQTLARLTIGPLGGIVIGTPPGGTNGDMGPGTINCQALYVNGVLH